MDIDEFLDRESKGVAEDTGTKVDAKIESLKLEHPDIVDEIKKYFKKNDYFNKIGKHISNIG